MTVKLLDEHRTSKVCSSCKDKELDGYRTADSDRPVYALKLCNQCSRVWNRDDNAARNLLRVMLWWAGGHQEQDRPPGLERNHGVG